MTTGDQVLLLIISASAVIVLALLAAIITAIDDGSIEHLNGWNQHLQKGEHKK